MVVVWSANHFYYNGELFSCLLYSSLEAIFLPPAEPVVNFGTTKVKGSDLLRACIVRKNTTNQTMVPLRTNSGEYDDYLLFSVGDTLSAIRRISASSFTSALYSITQLISGEIVQQR